MYSHLLTTRFRSMTLSIAGSVAGVLGLQNLAGFAFFAASVVFVNLVFIFVCAQGKPELYFSLYPSPVLTTALEKLIPSKAAQLRKPAAPHTKIFRLGVWIIWQGLQENLLSFILWWTFWHGIVHGTWCLNY